MNSCCITLQTLVRIVIHLVCNENEIDVCSRNIGMKINTFIDFISTWINQPRQTEILKIYYYPINKNIISPSQLLVFKSTIFNKVF